MKAHDHDKFLEAVEIELDGHEKMGNYKPIPIEKVPKGMKLLDMVWSMRHKRCIKTQEVYKWKAWLATRTWSSLLGYLRPSSDMADGPFLLNPLSSAWMAQPSIGLCHGVPTSTSRNAPLPTLTSRVQTKRNDTKISRAQAQAQRVQSETSRTGVEPIHGPRA